MAATFSRPLAMLCAEAVCVNFVARQRYLPCFYARIGERLRTDLCCRGGPPSEMQTSGARASQRRLPLAGRIRDHQRLP